MALEGKLSDFGLPDILQLISIQQKTGVLELISSNDQARLRFQNGDILNVSCASRGTITDILKKYLKINNKLSDEEIEQIEATARSTNLKFEKVLVTGRYLTNQELEDIVSQIMEEIIYDLFTWKEASYSFETESNILMPGFPAIIIRVDGLLMEGMRRIDEWPQIEKNLPDPRLCFTKNPKIPVKPDELPPDESRVYEKLDGKNSIQEIIEVLGLGRYRTYESIHNLLNAELIVKTEGFEKKAKKKTSSIDFMGIFAVLFSSLLTLVVSVVVVIAILIGGWFYRQHVSTIKEEKSFISEMVIQNEYVQLVDALKIYYMLHSRYPQTLDELVKNKIISEKKIKLIEKYYVYKVNESLAQYTIDKKESQ